MTTLRRTAHALLATFAIACAAQPVQPEDGDDPYKDRGTEALSRDGRWTLPADVRAEGERQTGDYEPAPRWDGGRSCGGGLLDGTRALGEQITARFGGASRFDGYNCRRNTADTSRTSMHGTGRAVDVYVPLSGGDADNDLGDPIANWLVENAERIGVQLIIWDRTKWNISYAGIKDAPYGGPHPHHDHLHIELTAAGAAGLTPFFASGPLEDDAPPEPAAPSTPSSDAPLGTAGCQDFCPYSRDGECDDGGPGALTSLCELGSDCSDCGVRSSTPSSPSPAPTECAWSGWRCNGARDGRERCDGGTLVAREVCDLGWCEPFDGDDECVARAVPVDEPGCTNTCRWAGDGECDDGGPGSAYAVCALGTDCGDCGPRGGAPAPAPTPAPASDGYAGLTLDGMEIPRAGIANRTLETFGYSVEPRGAVSSFDGRSFVRGRVSWFGGPADTGVSSTETGAITSERLRSLNDPLDPSSATLASRPEDYYYVAMRWSYSPRGVSWLRSARLLVVNPRTGARVVVRPVDWGPNPRLDRILDLSPQALADLGLRTDEEALTAWASPSTPLGPVR